MIPKKGDIFGENLEEEGLYSFYKWGTSFTGPWGNNNAPTFEQLQSVGFMYRVPEYLTPHDKATQKITDNLTDNGIEITSVVIDKTLEELATYNLSVWESEMSILDSQVTPRMIEDIYDFITGATTELPNQIGELMSSRKSKRAEKP